MSECMRGEPKIFGAISKIAHPDLSDDDYWSGFEAILFNYKTGTQRDVKSILRTMHPEDTIALTYTKHDDKEFSEYKNNEGKALCKSNQKDSIGEYNQILVVEDNIRKYNAAESPKSTSSESPHNGNSTDSSSYIFESPRSSDECYYDETDISEEESNDFYGSIPVSVGPLPSMPLYDTDFNLVHKVETPDAPELVPHYSGEEELPELNSYLNDDEVHISGTILGQESTVPEPIPHVKVNGKLPEVKHPPCERTFDYWTEMTHLPIDKGEITEAEYLAIMKEDEDLWKSEQLTSQENRSEDVDAEDSGREDAKLRSGLDFYEESIAIQMGSQANSRLLDVKEDAVFQDYETCVEKLQEIIQSVSSLYKYEIYLLLYPLIALTYLQMMASDNIPRARLFLNRYANQLDDSFTSRMSKLLNICRPADVPLRARKLLAGTEKLDMQMSAGALNQFVEHMESWPRSQQNKIQTHFLVQTYTEKDEPRQLCGLGQPLLEPIFWAAPEPLHKKDFATRPLLMARRRKKKELVPIGNVHLPPGDRIYTPPPQRMDILHRKTDEEYRMKLDRNNLPSVYLYNAPSCSDVVTCATFSGGISMLALGTVSSSIHIFSLKPTKLVQLKSANCLKALDIGMAGIDKGMLDPLKKFSRRTLHGHQGAVYRLSFNPDDRLLLSCSEDYTVRLWCLMSWTCVVIYPGHLAPVTCVTYAPLGYYFATASDDCTARIWVQDNKRPVRIFKGHLAELEVCQFHPNRHYLATGSSDATVRLWDILKGMQVRLFAGHRGRITVLQFSTCGRYLVSGGDDCLIMIWDTANERLMQFLSHHKSSINSIQLCLDSNLLVVGGQDCQLTVWDFKKILQVSKRTRSTQQDGLECPERPPTQDFLIRSFFTKDAPFYTIHFTRRNLLVAFCVASRETDAHLKKSREMQESKDQRREDLFEWMEFLDLLKMKAVLCDQNR